MSYSDILHILEGKITHKPEVNKSKEIRNYFLFVVICENTLFVKPNHNVVHNAHNHNVLVLHVRKYKQITKPISGYMNINIKYASST